MAKRHNEVDKELQLQAYNIVDAELALRSKQSIAEQVHAIIEAADDIQSRICEYADFIKIECYQRILHDWPELGMSRKCWLDTVAMRKLQRNKNLSQTFIDKVKRMLDGGKNDTALRDAIIDGLHNEDAQLAVPTAEVSKSLTYDKSVMLDSEFLLMLDNCVDTRERIDGILYPKLVQYSQAFEYITGETHKEFKILLDMWHYRTGGWPTDKTPPRCWGLIAKFRGLHDLLARYDFDMFDDWCCRFGMDIQFRMVTPAAYVWGPNAPLGSLFGKHTMFKLKDTALQKYADYGVQPWHHLIVIGDFAYAYVWDTRQVQLAIPASCFNLADMTNDYADLCQALVVDTTQFNDQALLDFLDAQNALLGTASNADSNDSDNKDSEASNANEDDGVDLAALGIDPRLADMPEDELEQLMCDCMRTGQPWPPKNIDGLQWGIHLVDSVVEAGRNHPERPKYKVSELTAEQQAIANLQVTDEEILEQLHACSAIGELWPPADLYDRICKAREAKQTDNQTE